MFPANFCQEQPNSDNGPAEFWKGNQNSTIVHRIETENSLTGTSCYWESDHLVLAWFWWKSQCPLQLKQNHLKRLHAPRVRIRPTTTSTDEEPKSICGYTEVFTCSREAKHSAPRLFIVEGQACTTKWRFFGPTSARKAVGKTHLAKIDSIHLSPAPLYAWRPICCLCK